MSILDPSIILASGDINNPNKLLDLKLGMQKLQANDQAMQKQNALKMLLASPQSYANGQLTPQAKQATFAADPELGLEIQKQDMATQVARAKQAASATAAGAKKFDLYSKLAGVGVNAYEDAKKSGKSEEDARGAAVQARNTAAQEAYESGNGLLSDQDYTGLTGHKFDPLGATALASLDKDWSTGREKAKSDDRADKRENRMEAHESTMEGLALRAATRSDDKPGQQETIKIKDKDGNVSEVQAFVKGPGKVVDIAGNDIDPGSIVGASKTGASSKGTAPAFTPEMGDLMAALGEKGVALPAGMRSKEQQISTYQGLLARNPTKTPDQIADMIKTGQIEFGAQKKETQTAAGQAGKVEVAQNELDEFIPLVRDAAKDMPRGNFVPVNKLLQMGDSAISDPALKTLKIRINSVLNAYDQLAARGGTDASKREEARSLITTADGPEALEAGLKSFELEAAAAHRAAVKATKVPELSNEDKKPTAKSTAALPKVSDKASYGALKSGDRFLDPEGHERVKP